MSFSLGRESEDGFHGEDSEAVALENDSVDGGGLSETLMESPSFPSGWCRVGDKSYLAALSTSPYLGDECSKPCALHVKGAEGTTWVSTDLLVESQRSQQVRSGWWGPREELGEDQDERVLRAVDRPTYKSSVPKLERKAGGRESRRQLLEP